MQREVYLRQSHVERNVLFLGQRERVDEEERAAVPLRRLRNLVVLNVGVGEIGAHVGHIVLSVAVGEQVVSRPV